MPAKGPVTRPSESLLIDIFERHHLYDLTNGFTARVSRRILKLAFSLISGLDHDATMELHPLAYFVLHLIFSMYIFSDLYFAISFAFVVSYTLLFLGHFASMSIPVIFNGTAILGSLLTYCRPSTREHPLASLRCVFSLSQARLSTTQKMLA